jgi:quercetin dioxygenase-like cupin family protein
MADSAASTQFTVVDDAASMAEFDEGRVKPVSVLKATGANVVIFAFDDGAVLREHSALQPVLLQTLEGALRVNIGGQDFELRPGGLLHIEPQVAHSVTALERSRLQLIVLMIDSPGPSTVPLTN